MTQTNTDPTKSAIIEMGETINTRAREDLAQRIKNVVQANGWTQTHAAGLCGQSQPRLSELLHGRFARFSMDNLLRIATVLEFHSKDCPAEQHTPEGIQRMLEMSQARRDSRPIKAVYSLATVGSKTVRGGEVVTSTTGVGIGGMDAARVGDLVRYPDGTESPIVSGSGLALVCDGKPMAIVGSHIENGDVIESSPQNGAQILQFADDEPIPGLLEIGYIPPTGRE